MALKKFGFIVSGKDLDPAMHKMTMASGSFEMIAVGVSDPEQGIPIAVDMVDNGIQLLELCGGFGPTWTARVIDAIEGKIPVGSVAYGPESIDALHALFRNPPGA